VVDVRDDREVSNFFLCRIVHDRLNLERIAAKMTRTSRVARLEPESSASTNSAMAAKSNSIEISYSEIESTHLSLSLTGRSNNFILGHPG